MKPKPSISLDSTAIFNEIQSDKSFKFFLCAIRLKNLRGPANNVTVRLSFPNELLRRHSRFCWMKLRISRYADFVTFIIMIPFEITQYLCISSGYMGVSSWILFLLGVYDVAFLLGIVSITSLNHWRKFELGWRRRLDLACVNLFFTYMLLKILFLGDWQQYIAFSLLVCTLIFFQISKSSIEKWVIFHISIHLYVSVFVPMLFLL